MAEENSSDSPFVTVAEIADVLQLNQQTVRNWIDQGALPAIRIGRRVRVRREDYERLLKNGLTLTGTEAEGPTPAGFWSGELPAVADL